MVNRKPKGWEDAFQDAIPFVRNLRDPKTPESVKKSIKATHKGGKATIKAGSSAAKYAFGDPSKGWQNVASETAMWLVPYSKIGKGAKTLVKNRKVVGKVASGAAQTVAALTAKPAADKALSKTRRKPASSSKKNVSPKRTPRKGR